MEGNVVIVADLDMADKIMDVLAQFGAFKCCEDCRFGMDFTDNLKTSNRGGIRCQRGLKPAGPDDGCYGWRPRRG